jgi:hypothetical protein
MMIEASDFIYYSCLTQVRTQRIQLFGGNMNVR